MFGDSEKGDSYCVSSSSPNSSGLYDDQVAGGLALVFGSKYEGSERTARRVAAASTIPSARALQPHPYQEMSAMNEGLSTNTALQESC